MAARIDMNFEESTGLIAGRNTDLVPSGLALLVAFLVYAAVEYAQTRRLDSITRQFDTRTLVMMPIAIALNIILGQAVGAALKIPIYLDSVGTILVGALAGPFPGLSPAASPISSGPPWSRRHSTATSPRRSGRGRGQIGLLAGIFGRLGFFRSRPSAPPAQGRRRIGHRRRRHRGDRILGAAGGS